MGKIFDFLLSGSWKEYQEIRTLKSVRKLTDKLSEEDLNKLSKEELLKLIKK